MYIDPRWLKCLLFHIHRFLDFWRRQTEPRRSSTDSFETEKRPPSSPTHSERAIHLGPQVHNTRNQATPLHTGRAQLAREFLRWLVFSLGPPARPLSLWHGRGERCFLSTFALGSPLVIPLFDILASSARLLLPERSCLPPLSVSFQCKTRMLIISYT